MKVIFSNVYSQQESEFTSLISIVPPLDLLYAASVLRDEYDEIEVDVIDANAMELYELIHVKRIVDLRPDFVIFSAKTFEINSIYRIVDEIKKRLPNTIIVLSGSHASALPKKTLEESRNLDFVFIGEGDSIIINFIKEFSQDRNYANIKGLGYREGKKVVVNEPSYVEDLSTLSLPARDLLNNSLYSSSLSSTNTSIRATRGCFGKCYYCDVKNCFGSKVRVRSASDVVQEIEDCYSQFGIKFFSFIDHLFSYDKSFVKDFSNQIIEKGLNKKIQWICNSRVDTLSEEELVLMSKAGCVMIGIGIEVGDNSVLEKIGKNITLRNVNSFIIGMKKAGILSIGYVIMGFPFETKKDIEKTKSVLLDLNPDFIQISMATPLPGSRLYSDTVRADLLLSQNWNDFAFLNKSIIRNPNFSSDYLIEFRNKAIRDFYFRITKILRLTLFLIFKSKVSYWNSFKSFIKIAFRL